MVSSNELNANGNVNLMPGVKISQKIIYRDADKMNSDNLEECTVASECKQDLQTEEVKWTSVVSKNDRKIRANK